MAKNLPVWLFMSIALILIGAALLPVIRVMFGVDSEISLAFTTVVILMIGGLMSGLSAMILLVRRAPDLPISMTPGADDSSQAGLLHASGFLLVSGVPLLNFLAAYWLWVRVRHTNPYLNWVGREVLNFQITIYLYLLLSLFMVFAFLGIITTPLLVLFHLIVTGIATVASLGKLAFRYPANIPIIQGRRANS